MWLARASRCSPWPNTKSSGGDAPLPLPLSSGAQGLFHGSVSFLGLSSLLLQKERTAADQMLLSCSFWLPLPAPLHPASLSPSVPRYLSQPQAHGLPVPRLRPPSPGLPGWCRPGVRPPAVVGTVGTEPRGLCGQQESCSSPHAQDPAALNKAAPSGTLGAGPLFYFCFFKTLLI